MLECVISTSEAHTSIMQPFFFISFKAFLRLNVYQFRKDISIFLVTLLTHRVPVFATQTLWSQFILIFVHLVAIYSCESFLIHFTFVTTYQRKIENSIINIKWNRKNNESTFSNSYKVKNQPNQIHVSNSNESNVYRMNVKEKWLNSAVLAPAVCCYFAKALCDWRFTLSLSLFLYFSFVFDYISCGHCYYVRVEIVVDCQWSVGGSHSCIK